jgi:hypothetical protein
MSDIQKEIFNQKRERVTMRELLEEFPESLPSNSALRSCLIPRAFGQQWEAFDQGHTNWDLCEFDDCLLCDILEE